MSSMPFKLRSDEFIVKALKDSNALKSIKPSTSQRCRDPFSEQTSRKPSAAQNRPKPSAAKKMPKPSVGISAAQKSLISFSAREGVVVGRLTFLLDGHLIDCEKSEVTLLPLTAEKVYRMQSNGALFILLVAHHSEFQILSEDRFFDRFPCILFMAHEENLPHKSYISFLWRMREELDLPILALVNCDPVGLQILNSYDAVDAWLGLRHSDLELYDLKPHSLTSRQVEILQGLKNRFAHTRPQWVPELLAMENYKEKANISSLRYYGTFYLPEVYLPLKLLDQAWI